MVHCKMNLCLLKHSKGQAGGKTADRQSPDSAGWMDDYEFAFPINDRSLSKGIFLSLISHGHDGQGRDR